MWFSWWRLLSGWKWQWDKEVCLHVCHIRPLQPFQKHSCQGIPVLFWTPFWHCHCTEEDYISYWVCFGTWFLVFKLTAKWGAFLAHACTLGCANPPWVTSEHRAQSVVTSRFESLGSGGGVGKQADCKGCTVLTKTPRFLNASIISLQIPEGKWNKTVTSFHLLLFCGSDAACKRASACCLRPAVDTSSSCFYFK